MNNRAWWLVVLSVLVAACGGGSGSTVGGTSASGSGSTAGGASASGNTLVLDSVQNKSSCSGINKVKLAGANVVLHDAKGQILGQYKTDSEGHFEQRWSSDIKFLTVYSSPDESFTYIRTMTVSQPGDLGLMTFGSNVDQKCQCKKVTVDQSEISRTMPEYTAYASLTQHQGSRYLGNTVSPFLVCASSNNRFGKMQVILTTDRGGDSFSREIDLDTVTDAPIKLMMNDFKRNSRYITLISNGRSVFSRSFVSTDEGPSYRVDSSTTALPVFSQGTAPQFVMVGYTQNVYFDANNTATFNMEVQQQLAANATSLQVPFDDDSLMLGDTLRGLKNILKGNAVTSVNLSNTNGYNVLRYQEAANNYAWFLTMPMVVVVPAFEWPTDLQNIIKTSDTRNKAHFLRMESYNPAWSYEQARAASIQSSRATSYEPLSPLHSIKSQFIGVSIR